MVEKIKNRISGSRTLTSRFMCFRFFLIFTYSWALFGIILCSVAESIMLYAAPVWAGSMNVAAYRQILQRVHRKMAIGICRAYRTVSHDAVMVLSSTVPIHLKAFEQMRVYQSELPKGEASTRERTRTIEIWQEEWENSQKGAWTRRLIPNVRPWLNRNHGSLNYFTTQVFSGHGSFRSYTNKIGKTTDDLCAHCGEVDTAEHTIFLCPRWEQVREECQAKTGEAIFVNNVVAIMLKSEENWTAISDMLTSIMSIKEEEGRRTNT